MEQSCRGVKLNVEPPSGSEVKDILNLTVVPISLIGTTTYKCMCLDGARLSLTEEQLCAKLVRFNESHHFEQSAFQLHTHTL
jgi:hypothetical protein